MDLGQVVLTVEVVPELNLVWLSGEVGEWDLGHADGGHNLVGGVEVLGLGEVWSKTLLSKNVLGHGEVVLGANEFGKDGGITGKGRYLDPEAAEAGAAAVASQGAKKKKK